MDVQKRFEYPLPIINKDVNKIFIETSKIYEGNLVIKNDGEGMLEGRIMSNSNFLSFNTEYFTGNLLEVTYTIDLGVYETDNKVITEAFIMSNGGEHIIEFIIKVVPHVINTIEGQNITSLKDFFSYYKKYPVSALQLFESNDFKTWLDAINYEYMDLYLHFSHDPNIDRGLNNFFIFNKLKYKTNLSIVSDNINIKINPYIKKKYIGLISIVRSGQGYIEEKLYTKNKSKWLKIEKDYITSSDFKTENTISLAYAIDDSFINKKTETDTLVLQSRNGRVNITVSILKFLNVYLEKEYIDLKEKGNIIINNYSEEEVNVEIVPKDNFLKLEKVIYKVGKYERVTFNIKLSTLQLAHRSLKKKPIYETEIYVTSYFKDEVYKKVLKLVIGNFI